MRLAGEVLKDTTKVYLLRPALELAFDAEPCIGTAYRRKSQGADRVLRWASAWALTHSQRQRGHCRLGIKPREVVSLTA